MTSKHKPEHIIGKLHEAEILLTLDGTVEDGGRRAGVTERDRLWLNGGSCIRLRPEYPCPVRTSVCAEGSKHDGRKLLILSIIDEASRQCLALPIARQIRSADDMRALAELFATLEPPAHIPSKNGP